MASATFVDRGVDPPSGEFEAEVCLFCECEFAVDSYGTVRHRLCEKYLEAFVCCGVQYSPECDECSSCGREFAKC